MILDAVLMVGLSIAGLAVLVGLGFTGLTLSEWLQKSGWPKTEATVRTSVISSESSGARYGGTVLRCSVEFDYSIDSVALHGWFFSHKRKHFSALQTKYKDGAVFDLFYNPKRPSHSEVRERLGVENESAWSNYALMCFIGGVAVAFLTCVAWALIETP
jgi:hypothetical protein